MLIQVIYPDDRYDYVKEFMLDELIESQKITRFRRRSGWVTLGVDPVRKPRRKDADFSGQERRAKVA